METKQFQFSSVQEFNNKKTEIASFGADLILLFGGISFFDDAAGFQEILNSLAPASVVGCSTAGEIAPNGVHDNTLCLTALKFAKSKFKQSRAPIRKMADSEATGRELAGPLAGPDLKAIFILGRGLDINGSAVIAGIRSVVGPKVTLTGGLAGDAGRFQKTYTVFNKSFSSEEVVAVGFYGEALHVSFGSMGGWEPFGPVRVVTKSEANVLYELDGKPALDIYKMYLGEERVKNLPFSALMFPFQMMQESTGDKGLTRTILGVDEATKAVTLAGDMPLNSKVRLMHASNEGLVAGAKAAAESAAGDRGVDSGLSVLISCVGRKLVMATDIEDELDAVKEILRSPSMTGFYSYGEICPLDKMGDCRLHNQTMTITHLWEES